MQVMLQVCERYGADHNLVFSTDPNPAKSKSKCLYMCGRLNVEYPVAVQLYNTDLSWVVTAKHLGHELHQCCNMEYDAKVKRYSFIDKSVNIRECFSFADPVQILKAVQVYAGDGYGSMLWNLYGEEAGKYFRTWDTCVKLTWNVSRATHGYVVDNLLAADFKNFREQILVRYVKFVRKLLSSKSDEVRLLANLVGRDAQSNTGNNLTRLWLETGLDPWSRSMDMFSQALTKARRQVPAQDIWRLEFLEKLLKRRSQLESNLENTDDINIIINSLCST